MSVVVVIITFAWKCTCDTKSSYSFKKLNESLFLTGRWLLTLVILCGQEEKLELYDCQKGQLKSVTCTLFTDNKLIYLW